MCASYNNISVIDGPNTRWRSHTILILQSGARNVIPLIVHITHFYYYKSICHLGTELILIGWKVVPNEEHVQCDHRFASQPLANEPLHSSQLFDTVMYQMSNAFVIIKMCYVNNQCYGFSCATLYNIKLYYIIIFITVL